MLLKVKMKQDFRVLKQGEEFEFHPGVNLLVGDQGAGKTSLLKILMGGGKNTFSKDKADILCDVLTETRSFDFEKDNPRVRSRVETMTDVVCIMASHGEVNRQMFKDQSEFKNLLIILDEPDSALSIRSCYLLVDAFNKAVDNGCQIVAAVHNPIIISSFPSVLSMEHRHWMKSQDFVLDHTPNKKCPLTI